jgi:hypothetical protein
VNRVVATCAYGHAVLGGSGIAALILGVVDTPGAGVVRLSGRCGRIAIFGSVRISVQRAPSLASAHQRSDRDIPEIPAPTSVCALVGAGRFWCWQTSKLNVAGSSPVSRSGTSKPRCHSGAGASCVRRNRPWNRSLRSSGEAADQHIGRLRSTRLPTRGGADPGRPRSHLAAPQFHWRLAHRSTTADRELRPPGGPASRPSGSGMLLSFFGRARHGGRGGNDDRLAHLPSSVAPVPGFGQITGNGLLRDPAVECLVVHTSMKALHP